MECWCLILLLHIRQLLACILIKCIWKEYPLICPVGFAWFCVSMFNQSSSFPPPIDSSLLDTLTYYSFLFFLPISNSAVHWSCFWNTIPVAVCRLCRTPKMLRTIQNDMLSKVKMLSTWQFLIKLQKLAYSKLRPPSLLAKLADTWL